MFLCCKLHTLSRAEISRLFTRFFRQKCMPDQRKQTRSSTKISMVEALSKPKIGTENKPRKKTSVHMLEFELSKMSARLDSVQRSVHLTAGLTEDLPIFFQPG
jgi:hypothetical protein